jgi:thioredoxin-related protein
MKRIIIVFLICLLNFSYSFSQEWQSDIETSKAIAAKQNRPIILVFQGSDWCAPCIKLDREVFSSETFKLYAKDHFVMLKADFPKKKKNVLSEEQQLKNNALAEKYNKRGIFPFVVILDANGKVLGETGYMKSSPSAYISHLESFKG